MEQSKYDIFISYSRIDYLDEYENEIPGNEISKILQALSDEHITYWIDKKGIDHGANIPVEIENNIKASRIILFLSTSNSNFASNWTLNEIAYAHKISKHIIPVRIDKSQFGEGIGFFLAPSNTIDYYNDPEQKRIDMINAINQQLNIIKQEEQIAEKIELSWEELNQREKDIESKKHSLLHNSKKQITDKSILKELLETICPKKDNSNTNALSQKDQLDNLRRSNDLLEEDKKRLNNKNTIFKTIAIITSLSALCLLFCTIFQNLYSKQTPKQAFETMSEQDPMLIFSGGGSVYNYICEHQADSDTISLANYDNAIYINQPSGNAWSLLLEEAMTDKRRFCSICLSSDIIDTTRFNNYDAFSNDTRIVQLLIGHDPLIIYAQKKPSFISDDVNIITLQELSTIFNNKKIKREFRFFSTSRNSGTLRTYQRYLSLVDTTLQLESLCFPFYEDDSPDYMKSLNQVRDPLKKKPFFVLGSKYYFPKEIVDQSIPLILMDDTITLKKPVYIYFIATKDPMNKKFKINKRIISFLKKIGAKQNIDATIWNSIEKEGCIASQGDLIIDINDTSKVFYQEEKKRLNHLNLKTLK